jgi:hypothetical protein
VPVELFFSIADQRPLSNLAPRGSPADPDIESPAQVAFLDPDGDGLPILIPTAA